MLAIHEVTCLVSRWACVLGLLVLAIVGCGEATGAGGTGGSGASAGSGGVLLIVFRLSSAGRRGSPLAAWRLGTGKAIPRNFPITAFLLLEYEQFLVGFRAPRAVSENLDGAEGVGAREAPLR